jgi:hypothetical protein
VLPGPEIEGGMPFRAGDGAALLGVEAQAIHGLAGNSQGNRQTESESGNELAHDRGPE